MKKSYSKIQKAYIGNIITFALVSFSALWMFSGFHFGKMPTLLTGSRLSMFKFYTTDSNILMGIIALIVALVQKKVIDGRLEKLPAWVYPLKLLGTVGVTLTMLVTIFFLVPTMGFLVCFNNSNIFLHLINPVVSIVTFLCFESTDELSFKHTCTGIISMLIYAVYYVAEAVIHSHGNIVDKGYDWYGFLVLGLKSGFIIIPIIILITYAISLCLWFLNRKLYKTT